MERYAKKININKHTQNSNEKLIFLPFLGRFQIVKMIKVLGHFKSLKI
jgi:hypothetical protein